MLKSPEDKSKPKINFIEEGKRTRCLLSNTKSIQKINMPEPLNQRGPNSKRAYSNQEPVGMCQAG